MINKILSILPGDHPWQNTLYVFDTVPSTNDLAKDMAKQGAPEGSVYLAQAQTAGRGRMGRSFYAQKDMGVYLSVVLRPNCHPEQLMHLTCAAAEAACNAVEQAAGIRPQIKWTNDLVYGSKKLGGILTEMSVSSRTGLVEWAVVGIGINCRISDFPPEIQNIATSLLCLGADTEPWRLAAHLIAALSQMRSTLFTEKAAIMAAYRQDCMTLGKQVMLLRGEEKTYGTALDIDDDGGLLVRFADGSCQTVTSGEISVRGLYGYA